MATAEADVDAQPNEELAARRRARHLEQVPAQGWRARLLQRIVPSGLAQIVAGRLLAISVITLARRLSAWRAAVC